MTENTSIRRDILVIMDKNPIFEDDMDTLHAIANPAAQPRTPAGARIYAIGDVHGRLDLLDRLLASIATDHSQYREHPPAERTILITLGDLIDRGPASRGVIERLMTLGEHPPFDGFELYGLKGNHEYMLEAFLTESCGNDALRMWLDSGGRETLQSYGIANTYTDFATLRQAAQAALPERHLRYVSALKALHREGDYAFVHAGVRPGVHLNAQTDDDLMWIRRPFLDDDGPFGAHIVHGHSPVDVPDVRDHRTAIDTRAWQSGTLTCLALQGADRWFLST